MPYGVGADCFFVQEQPPNLLGGEAVLTCQTWKCCNLIIHNLCVPYGKSCLPGKLNTPFPFQLLTVGSVTALSHCKLGLVTKSQLGSSLTNSIKLEIGGNIRT